MGAVATAIFDCRNVSKVAHGDTGRVGAVAVQTTNLINAASKSSVEPVKNSATTILNYVDDAGKAVGISNAASKITGFASKAVNPLLCVASGVRVLKDDDQYSALIEETCAMGTMFASEKLFKKLVANPIAGKEMKNTTKWVAKIADKVSDSTKNIKGGKKTLLKIAADVALVGVSMLGFNAGKKVGKMLSGRDDESKVVQENKTQGLDYTT